MEKTRGSWNSERLWIFFFEVEIVEGNWDFFGVLKEREICVVIEGFIELYYMNIREPFMS